MSCTTSTRSCRVRTDATPGLYRVDYDRPAAGSDQSEIVFQLALTPKDVEDLVGLPNCYLSEMPE
jgi:hypothetical protein